MRLSVYKYKYIFFVAFCCFLLFLEDLLGLYCLIKYSSLLLFIYYIATTSFETPPSKRRRCAENIIIHCDNSFKQFRNVFPLPAERFPETIETLFTNPDLFSWSDCHRMRLNSTSLRLQLTPTQYVLNSTASPTFLLP